VPVFWASASIHLASPITVVSILIFPLLLCGVLYLRTTTDPEKMFPEGHVVNQHRDWLTSRFSQIEAIDLIATFPGDFKTGNPLDQLRQVRTIQHALSAVPEVTSTFSVANVIRLPVHKTRSAKTILQKNIFNDAIRAERESLQAQRLLAVEPDSVSYRIRVGLACEGTEHTAIASRLESVYRNSVRGQDSLPEIWATGICLITSAGRDQILDDLATSATLALLIITPLVMILLRGIVVGLLAMIPNVLPAAAFFGTIGWLGIEIDIGTLLTASVGLGIAVDDTLHFLHVFRRELQHGDRFTATWRTVGYCWRPMLFTSLICAGGLALFAFSSFIPARQFSIAIVILLGTAVVCDLVVLPAMILSPCGRFFADSQLRHGQVGTHGTEIRAKNSSQRPDFNPLVGYHHHTS